MFRRVYLDNSATTPLDPRVLEAMLPYLTEKFGNASSIHFFGQEARNAVDRARHQVADMINARPKEIIFTSGGTEANNLAIRGLVDSPSIARRLAPKSAGHIITSQIEHPSVLNTCEDLETRGWNVTRLPVYEHGIVRIEDVKAAIRDDTALISIMTANNEIGTLQPIAEIGKLVRELKASGRRIYFHTDAVQAAGKIGVDVEESGCDLLSISAHKIHAPKGIGALYARRGLRLHPQNFGGHQEAERRGGTESVANIVAFGTSAEIAAESMPDLANVQTLRDRIENEAGERIPDVIFNGDREHRLPNIANISFKGVEGEALLINLDLQGVAVSTGSACSSGTLEPSPVIRALGNGDDIARSAIRFSLSRLNTSEDIDRLFEVLPSAIDSLRRLSRN